MEITISCSKKEEERVYSMLKQINPGLTEYFDRAIEIESDNILLWKSGANIDIHLNADVSISIIDRIECFISIIQSINTITSTSFKDLINNLDDFTIRVNGNTVSMLEDSGKAKHEDSVPSYGIVFNGI